MCANNGTGLSQSTFTVDTYSADIVLNVETNATEQYNMHDGDQVVVEGRGYYWWRATPLNSAFFLSYQQGWGYFGCETASVDLTFECVPDSTTSSHTEVTVSGTGFGYVRYNGSDQYNFFVIPELTEYHIQAYASSGYRFPEGVQTLWEGTTESCHLPPANASFSAAPTQGVAPLSVVFTPVTTETALSMLWDFGDGVTDTVNLNPTHVFATSGIYTPTFTITTAGGTDTKEGAAIHVYSPANAIFTASPVNGTAPLTVTFTPVTTDTPVSLLWDFGDGKTDSANMHPTHVYTPAGVYTPTFTITTAGGTDTRTGQAITVNKVVVPTSEVYLPLILK